MKTLICMLMVLGLNFNLYADSTRLLSGQENQSIGIIGAGASGLSAAYYLKKKGYKDITLLEKNDHAGGKCLTINKDGRSYEMGAIMYGSVYKTVKEIADDVNYEITKFSEGSDGLVKLNPNKLTMNKLSFKDIALYAAAAARYSAIYFKYRRYVRTPGIYTVPKELSVSFERFIEKEAPSLSKRIQSLLSHSFVSFGYGHMSEVPAIYVLKYFSPKMLVDFMSGNISMIKNGYQELWKKVAQNHNVLYNFNVINISRINSKWVVTSRSGDKRSFDKLIITIPLDIANYLTQFPADIQRALSNIKYQYYHSVLVETQNFYKGNGVIPQNYIKSKDGGLVSWLYRYSDSNLVNFYYLGDKKQSNSFVEEQILNLSDDFDFQVKSFEKNVRWRYFPHFKTEQLNNKIYRKLHEYNGTDGLFLAGEIMNFSTVEHTARFSKHLVDNFFESKLKLSYSPYDYDQLSANDKKELVWDKIISSQYEKLPSYQEQGDSFLQDLYSYTASMLNRSFDNQSDFLEVGRNKVIHKLGSAAKFIFKSKSDRYNDFEGIIRLSNAVNSQSGTVYPSFSMKIFRDNINRSINFNIGKSFDGQRLSNGEADFNFFKDSPKAPFSNELSPIATSVGGKVFKKIFELAHPHPNYIPIEGIKNVMNTKSAPRRLTFVAPSKIRSMMDSNIYSDERLTFNKIKKGSILFNVYESEGLNTVERLIGVIQTDSPFISSKFGDKNLYFRHER